MDTLIALLIGSMLWAVVGAGALRIAARRRQPTRALIALSRRELALTTAVLAAPGLVAAVVGVLSVGGALVAAVPLVAGIAIVRIASKVSSVRPTLSYGFPLGFVLVVDVLVAWWFMAQAADAYAAVHIFQASVVAVYLAASTANAVRVAVRGRRQWRRYGAPAWAVASIDPRATQAPAVGTPGAFEPPVDLFTQIARGGRMLD